MSWAAVIGQALPARLLRQAVTRKKLSHAFLFVGPDGVGKRTVALTLAQGLNCRLLLPEGACGTCPSCVKFLTDPVSHPDVTLVKPEGRVIRIDQVRELQAEMYARPTEGSYRIAIIDSADRMNAESSNRLLKLLEEPPAHAILILLTTNLAGVLPTLISRCQLINFSPLTIDEVSTILVSRYRLEPGQARLYATLSGGSVGRALAMQSDSAVVERRDQCFALLNELPRLDDFDLVSRAEQLDKQRGTLDEWLEMSLSWLRDAVLVSDEKLVPLLLHADRLHDVQTISDQVDRSGLLKMISAVQAARQQIQRNANVRLVMDVLLLDLHGSATPSSYPSKSLRNYPS